MPIAQNRVPDIPMEKIRLLIVEEVSRIREVVRYALENSFSEIEIHEADNAGDAKAKLENIRYDLILCDWDAPNIKGDQLLKWMKGHAALNSVPFIMLTSRSEKSYLAKALQLGVNSYLIKPFSHAGMYSEGITPPLISSTNSKSDS